MAPCVQDSICGGDDGDDADPRFVSSMAKSLPALPQRCATTITPDRPQCVLALATCNHASTIAALVSDRTVRTFDPSNLAEIRTISNHVDHIRALRPMPDSSALFTASEDGCWKLVDLRTGTVQLSVQSDQSLFSFDCNGVVAAAGIDEQGAAALWDIRNCSAPLAVLEGFHTDEVRAVRFHPIYKSLLFTGSVDCLINKFDLNAASLDDALVAVFNTDQSVRSFEFFGAASAYLYAISEIETLSLCDLGRDERMCSVPDICDRLSAEVSVRYLIDCYYDAEQTSLCVFAGNYYGDVLGSLVCPPEFHPALTMFNGHCSGVRALTSIDRALFTGGEDSRIASWSLHR